MAGIKMAGIGLLIVLLSGLSVRSQATNESTSKKLHDKRQIPWMIPFQSQQSRMAPGYPYTRTRFPTRYQYNPGYGLAGGRNSPIRPVQSTFGYVQTQRNLQRYNSRKNNEYIPYYYPHRTHYRDWSRKVVKASAASRRLDITEKQKTSREQKKLSQGGAGIKFFIAGLRPTGTIVGKWMSPAQSPPAVNHQNPPRVAPGQPPKTIFKGPVSYRKQSTSMSASDPYEFFKENTKYRAPLFSTDNGPFQQKPPQVIGGQKQGNPSDGNFYRPPAAVRGSKPHLLPTIRVISENENKKLRPLSLNTPSIANPGLKDVATGSSPDVHSSAPVSPQLKHDTAASENPNKVVHSDKLEGATLGPNAHSLIQPTVPQQSAQQSKDGSPGNHEGPLGGNAQNSPIPLPGIPNNNASPVSGPKADNTKSVEGNFAVKNPPSVPENLVPLPGRLSLGNSIDMTSASQPNAPPAVQVAVHAAPVMNTTPRVLPQTTATSLSQQAMQNQGSARANIVPRLGLEPQQKQGLQQKMTAYPWAVSLNAGRKAMMVGNYMPSVRPETKSNRLPKSTSPNNINKAAQRIVVSNANVAPISAIVVKTSAPGAMLRPTVPNPARSYVNPGIKNAIPGNSIGNSILFNKEMALKNLLFPPPTKPMKQGLWTTTTPRGRFNAFQRSKTTAGGLGKLASAQVGKKPPFNSLVIPPRKQIPRLSFNNFRVNRLSLNFPLPGQPMSSSYRRNNVPGNAGMDKKTFIPQHSRIPYKGSFPLMLHKISPYFKMKRNLKHIASEQAKARKRLLELQPI